MQLRRQSPRRTRSGFARAPPTDKEYNVVRAFKAAGAGVVGKTLCEDTQIVNVTSRYGAVHLDGQRNDGVQQYRADHRPAVEVNVNLARSSSRSSATADRAVNRVSLMLRARRIPGSASSPRSGDGADGRRANFGCPHGMRRRGMGAPVRPGPRIRRDGDALWCKAIRACPFSVKLSETSPTSRPGARARQAAADAVVADTR